MNITRLAVRNPVGTILIMLVVLVLGVLAIIRLPTGYFPVFAIPASVIITNYPGASALEVEQEITKPIERTVASVSNIEKIRSTSSEGFSQIQLSLEWDTDLDEAVYEIQTQLERIRNELPREAEKPTILTINSLIQVSMELGVSSETRDLAELKEYVEDYLQDRLSRVDEVATVRISGGNENIVQVLIDRDKLSSRNLSINQVVGALQQNNVTMPGGRVTQNTREYIVRAIGEYQTVDEIRRTLISNVRKTPVYLENIADVSFTEDEERTYTRINCNPSVSIGIGTRSDGNIVAMSDAVREELEIIRQTLPEDIEVFVALDQAEFIRRSIGAIARDALIGGLLASLVILLFLGSIRNSIVVVLSIPMSIMATFMLMRAFGLSLNIVSLGGLALGIGLVVDSAIVVLENIYRHMNEEPKENREETTVFATREVGLAITASTFTTLSVFIPMIFLRGLAAVFLGELALTVVFAVLASLLVALTVVPMLGYKLIRTDGKISSEKFWTRIRNPYRSVLDWCLRHRWITLVIALLIFGLSLVTIKFIDLELLPSADEGQFEIRLDYPVGNPLEETKQTACKIEKFLSDFPEVKSVFTTIGEKGAFGEKAPYHAEMIVQLVSSSEREPIEKIMRRIRQNMLEFPGAEVKVAQRTLTRDIGGAAIDVRIQGRNLETLKQLGQQAVKTIEDIPGLVNLNSSLSQGKPEIQVEADREKLADLGITASDIAMTLRTAIAGSTATKWSREGREYDVKVRLPEQSRDSTSDVGNLLISTRDGNISLNQLAQVKYGEAPISIERTEQIRNVVITADTSGRDRRSVISDIRERLDKLELPEGYQVSYEGQSRAIRESFNSLTTALIIAVFLVYVVMGVQFGSFIYPFIIMFSLPLAFIGMFFALWIGQSSLSLNSFLGGLVLTGIVVNDAIVLVDYINTLRERGMERLEALLEAGSVRLRPILMTSFTTIFGMLPIALGIGEGAETLAPLGIAVIGGLLTSTFLTLLIIPCVYTVIDDIGYKEFGE